MGGSKPELSSVISNQSFRRSVHPDDIPFRRFKCPLPLLQKMNSLFQWLRLRQVRRPLSRGIRDDL